MEPADKLPSEGGSAVEYSLVHVSNEQMLTSWGKEDERWEKRLHTINSQGLSFISFKPKASKAFCYFRKGFLLSQLSTLPVANCNTDSPNRVLM